METQKSLAAESAPHRPARPLLGALPVARVIPINVHAAGDYTAGLIGLSALFMAETTRAKVAGAMLGASIIGVSLLTDYPASVAKVIPIEIHEVADYVSGLSMVAAPFALGYFKDDPAVATMQVVTGLTVILTSLFTDYKAVEGVGARLGKLTNKHLS